MKDIIPTREGLVKQLKTPFGIRMVGLTGLILIQLLLAGIFLPNLWTKIWESHQKRQVLIAEVKDLTKASEALAGTDGDKLLGFREKVLAALPAEKKVSGVVSGVSVLASQSGVVVTSIEFSPGKISTTSAINEAEIKQGDLNVGIGHVQAIPANLVVSGSTAAVLEYLNKLAEVSQLIGINGIAMAENDSQSQIWTIGLLIYYQLAEEETIVWSNVEGVTPAEEEVLNTLPRDDIFILQESN